MQLLPREVIADIELWSCSPKLKVREPHQGATKMTSWHP